MIKLSNPIYFFIVIFFAYCFNTYSQITTKSNDFEKLIKQGDSLVEAWKLDEANEKYILAKTGYEKRENWEKIAHCLNKIAELQIKEDKYKNAFRNAKKALRIVKNNIKEKSIEEYISYYIIATYHDFVGFDYEKAMEFFNRSLEIKEYYPIEAVDYLAKINNALGILHSKNGLYEEAIPFYNRALNSAIDINGEKNSIVADIYGNLGLNYHAFGNYEKSIFFQKKAIIIDVEISGENTTDVAIAYFNISETYASLFEIKKAVFFGEKALGIVLDNLGEEHPFTAELYQNLSSQYLSLGKTQKAQEFAERSYLLASKKLGENHPQLIFALNSLAVVEDSKGNTNAALEYSYKALQICTDTYKDNHVRTAIAYSRLSRYLRSIGDIEKAVKSDLNALKIYKKIYKKNNHQSIGDVYYSLGKDYQMMGQDSLTLQYFFNALKVYESIIPINKIKISKLSNSIGNYYFQKNKYGKAKRYFKNASDYLSSYTENENGSTNNRGFLVQDLYVEEFMNNAKLLLSNNEVINKDYQYNQLKSLYRNVDSVIDNMRLFSHDLNDKLIFADKTKNIYNDIIFELLKKFNDGKDNPEDIFYFVEKSRFSLLKELTTFKDDITFPDIPIYITSKEDSLKRKQSYYFSKLSNSQKETPEQLAKYQKKLFQVNLKYDSLLKNIQRDFPKYFSLKYKNEVIGLEELSDNLDSNSTLLYYVKLDEVLFALIITKDNFKIVGLEDNGVNKYIKEFKTSIVNKDKEQFKKIGHKLYKKLIEPFKTELKGESITIIPDNTLWNLNFELLLTQRANSNDPREYPYLLKKYAINYANSASIYVSGIKDNTILNGKCLAFSFSKDNQNSISGKKMTFSELRNTNVDLPGTRSEIREISKILNGDYLYGDMATESAFKKSAEKYAILHLALHGEVNHKDPRNSTLFFTKGQDSIEDGYLYSHELYSLKLPADLAVLSACNTGVGKLASGEGIMSLGNAFQYAGTKSLMLSRWEVSDITTPDLMKSFYQNLKNGMTKSVALQKAKLSYLKNSDPTQLSPFYWGSFYVLGNNEVLSLDTKTNWKPYLYALIGLVLLGLLYIKFKSS